MTPYFADVTNKWFKFLPINVTLVIFSAGKLIEKSILPFFKFILLTLAPAQCATQSPLLLSKAIPSGKPSFFFNLISVLRSKFFKLYWYTFELKESEKYNLLFFSSIAGPLDTLNFLSTTSKLLFVRYPKYPRSSVSFRWHKPIHNLFLVIVPSLYEICFSSSSFLTSITLVIFLVFLL